MTFDEWYAIYPRKVCRKDAQIAWNKLTPEQRFAASESLPIHVRYWTAAGTAKEYLPYPASWINGERWTDELEMPAPKNAMGEWWKTPAGIEAKAKEVGCWPARQNEGWHELKARILAKERAA